MISCGDSENFSNFTTFTTCKLTRKGKKIYEDKKGNTEYVFADSLYPLIVFTGNNSYQVLIEINDRPSKNYLKCLVINNGQLIRVDTLPTFFAKAKNLDADSLIEFAGILDYGVEWTDDKNQLLISYNPIIYYELTPKGLRLDSALTTTKNTAIYRQFHGYRYSERFTIEVSALGDRLMKEIARIEN